MSNIILLDTSYITFNKFYAIKRWYSYKYPDEKIINDEDYDWFKNDIFIKKFKEMYLKSIIQLFDIEILNNCIIIFCLDAPQKNVWRNEFYEDYKKGRINKCNYKNTMDYVYNILLPDIIKQNNNFHSIYIDKVEADDIIATATNYIKNMHDRYTIYIVTNDNDLKQLGDDNIYFINLVDKKFININKIDAEILLNNKILYGDKSDNIKTIFKTGFKLDNKAIKKKDLLNNNILQHYLSINYNAYERYKLNIKLINLNYLPTKYKEIIIKKIKIII